METINEEPRQKVLNSQAMSIDKLKELLNQLSDKLLSQEEMSETFLNVTMKYLSDYWGRVSIAQ